MQIAWSFAFLRMAGMPDLPANAYDSIYNCHVAMLMAKKRTIKLKCPICKQPVTSAAVDFPFCSERCRVIDLGKWASGQYVVSSPALDTSDDTEIQNFPGTHRNVDDED